MKKILGMLGIYLAACIITSLMFGFITMLIMVGASFTWLQPAVICHKRGETNGAALFGVAFVVTCLFGIWLGSLFH